MLVLPTIASLCSGYAGLDRAVELALGPITHLWHAESNADTSRVLEAHYPGIPNLGDITTHPWRTGHPRPDILTAGWPCQPFSAAGKRRGTADDRHIWPSVETCIYDMAPPIFVGENVPNLLTIEHGQVFGRVLADLSRAGYAVRWTLIGACRVGCCHHRHRVVVLAARHPWFRPPTGAAPYAALLMNAMWTRTDDSTKPLKWPHAGAMLDGRIWADTADTCGARKRGSVLPTPSARDGRRGSGYTDQPGRPLSETILRLLPTPTASLATKGVEPISDGRTPRGHGANLGDVIVDKLLPTPRARDWKGAETPEAREGRIARGTAHAGYDLPTALRLLPTPRATDGTKGGPNQRGSSGDLMLPSAVLLLPTPTAKLGDARRGSPSPEVGARRLASGRSNLDDAVAASLLPTPTVADARNSRNATAGRSPGKTANGGWTLSDISYAEKWGEYGLAIARHELVAGRPAPEPTSPGRLGLPRLSPKFVEWMMCLDDGWVTDILTTRNPALTALGNGVNPPQIAAGLAHLGIAQAYALATQDAA